MHNQEVVVKQEGKVLFVTLNRPRELNALNLNMKEKILEALMEAKLNPNIHSIVLSGNGPSFSSGGDLNKMKNQDSLGTFKYLERAKELILAMAQLEKPIIAAVHGNIAGGGCCLALGCDVIFAAEDSKFHFSFSRVGLLADNGGMFFLSHTIGLYRTKDILFKGEPLKATAIRDMGLINYIYPQKNVMDEARKYADKLANGPLLAYGLIKKITNLALVSNLENILELERSNQVFLKQTLDHREGVEAFLEKRDPIYRGK